MSVSRFRWDFSGFVLGAALTAAPACAVITSFASLSEHAGRVRVHGSEVRGIEGDRGPGAQNALSRRGNPAPHNGESFPQRDSSSGFASDLGGVEPLLTGKPLRWTNQGRSQSARSEPRRDLPYLREPAAGLYEVTAYSHGCILPRSGGEGPARRGANGRWPVADLTIAADTSIHPFGSELLIAGVGFRTVGDRGHAIKGRKLDLFVDSCREARTFGRRWLSVVSVSVASSRWSAQ